MKHYQLRRYLCGITIVCFLVAVCGSFIAGAGVRAAAFRGLVVVAVLGYGARLLIKTWGLWSDIASNTTEDHRLKR